MTIKELEAAIIRRDVMLKWLKRDIAVHSQTCWPEVARLLGYYAGQYFAQAELVYDFYEEPTE